jgi:hypothetical protein
MRFLKILLGTNSVLELNNIIIKMQKMGDVYDAIKKNGNISFVSLNGRDGKRISLVGHLADPIKI